MTRFHTYILLPILFALSAYGARDHLDIKVPELMDTDLSGPVESVETKVSVNVSGQFERTYSEYDKYGNLVTETEWDHEENRLNTTINHYDDTGTFVRQEYMNYEAKYTNDWEVILNPDTRQIAMKEANGKTALYTYSPEKYLVSFRYMGADKKLRSASYTKRDENNRPLEYTRLDDRKKPLYTFWFKWKDDGVIDRERQRYRQEEGERLHVYEYLKTDSHGNWTQRLMVRYDIGGRERKKVYERLVTRTINYYGDEETAADDKAGAESFDTAPVTASTDSTNAQSAAVSSNAAAVASAAAADESGAEAAAGAAEAIAGASEEIPVQDSASNSNEDLDEILNAGTGDLEFTFDDISDKLVIISCKNDTGRGSGSGFVAKMHGRTYLFTNQHIIMGSDTISFKTADGETLTPRRVELSTSRDIARILIDDREGFEVSSKVALGIPIGVFGNSEGADVATELFGEVTDLGADLVEITAEFVSGNSGSPVLDRNRNVIGIASFVRILWKSTSDDDEENTDEEAELESTTRRFCYRLTDVGWKPVKWKQYNKEYGKLYLNCKNLSENVFGIISIWADAPVEKIPHDDSMSYDIIDWVENHNNIIDRLERREFSRREFFAVYSRSLEELSRICASRSRQAKMFSSQRELTGWLKKEFTKQSWSLNNAAVNIQRIADNL